MEFDVGKLAYCGIYCAQCSFATAYETGNRAHLLAMPEKYDKFKNDELSECACGGCKAENICGDCAIKDCAAEKAVDCCADCPGFPCETLLAFANDGVPHHKAAVENLEAISAVGSEEWFKDFSANLQCDCGERLSWYYRL